MKKLGLFMFVLAVSAMKRTAEDCLDGGRNIKRQNRLDFTEISEDSPFQCLPNEITFGHIIPEMSPSSILLLSLTCKANYNEFNGTARQTCVGNIDSLYNDLLQAAAEEAGSPKFESLRRIFSKSWPTSSDCYVRLNQKIALNGLLCNAAGIPLLAPTTHAFPNEHLIMYPGTGPCMSHILHSKIFKDIALSAEMVSQYPLELLQEYAVSHRPFPFVWKSGAELKKLTRHPETLRKLLGSEMLNCVVDHEYIFEGPLFHDLLQNGLDALDFDNHPEYELENDAQDEYFEDDQPVVEVALEMANEGNMDKLVKILDLIDEANARGFTKLLCYSKKLDDHKVLTVLYRDDELDLLLTLAIMIDSGRTPVLEWVSLYMNMEPIFNMLTTYSPESKSFLADIEIDSRNANAAIFTALLYGITDEALIALVRQFKSSCSVGLFFLLLTFRRTEACIKQVFDLNEPVSWELNWWNAVKNVTISPTLLPYVIARLRAPEHILYVIPRKRKYIEAVKACQREGLWTENFKLKHLIHTEILVHRPMVLQALLQIGCLSDWFNFVVEPIIADYDRQALLLSEFLSHVPTKNLFEAIEHNKAHLSADMFDRSSETDIQCSMLPLIFPVLLSRFDGFKLLMKKEEYRPLCLIVAKNTWSNMFPSEANPFGDNADPEAVHSALMKVVDYLKFGQVKAYWMAPCLGYLIVSRNLELPEEMADMSWVRKILKFATSAINSD